MAAGRLTAMRVPLRSSLEPERAVLWLRGDARPFALVGDWLDGTALLGSEPVRIADPREDPFALLDEMPDVDPGEALVGGGWVGWLGYQLAARIERLPPPPPSPVTRPAFSLAFYDHVIRFDGRQWWFEALCGPGRAAALEKRLAVWAARLQAAPPALPEAARSSFALASNGAEGHLNAVADCRRRIEAGEIYQANLCLRLEAKLSADLLSLFAHALPRARPRFGALVDGALSLSPERFLRREGRRVHTEPIKGTRPRAGGLRAAQAAREALVGSSKDAAEHVMIVDLMRNDLGRVCEYGTVGVAPVRVEAHAGVWHLVSTVSGRLRSGVSDGDLLRATFPPGSVTGAPKVQAMTVIATLEASRRELYTGAIGLASPIAGLDLNVAIRTFEANGGRIWFGAGGGIVADSEPELELAEALDKAAGPIAAIGGQIDPSPPRRRRPKMPDRSALMSGLRPDPARGVFETMLVEDGHPIQLAEHLERLGASLSELYGAQLDTEAATRACAVAATAGGARARLRILADPDGSLQFTLAPLKAGGEPGAPPVVLRPFTLAGGLGRHKWRDRRLLDALAASAPGTVPLLVDTDGLVLEAAYANVWIVENEAVLTPPADGRILPGITRAALLSTEAAARDEAIDLDRLDRADAVFLTSSIRLRHSALLPGSTETALPVAEERV